MAMNGNEELARRIRGGREVAGLRSAAALAEKIGEQGLSTSTIYSIEQAQRIVEPSELAAIAKACGLPVAFFEMDFWEAARLLEERAGQPTAADRLNEIATVVDELRNRVSALELARGRAAVEALERVEQALRAAGLPVPPRPPQ